MVFIEDHLPVVKYNGLNTAKAVDFSNSSSVTLPATGVAGSSVTAPATLALALNTTSDNKQVTLNSRTYTQASGDTIGFASKPNQTVTSTGSVYGAQISPRVTNVDLGNMEGLDVAPILKGTTGGTISGDFRGMTVELDDDAATWAVGGDAVGIRIFQQLKATVTGDVVAIKVDAAGDSTPWTSLIEIPTALTSGSNGGGSDVYILCTINGVAAKIAAKFVA